MSETLQYNATSLDVSNNPAWDIAIDADGKLKFLNQGEQITQNVNQRLKLLFEEWFLDRSIGVPWIQKVFTTPLNIPLAESIIKQHVNRTRGVVALLSFETSVDARKRLIHFSKSEILTDYGIQQQEL